MFREYSCWSRHRPATAAGAFVLYIPFVIFHLVHECQLKFKSTIEKLFEDNDDSQSVAVGYFDQNNLPDFVIANRAVDSISVFIATDVGSFAKPRNYHTDISSKFTAWRWK